MPVVVNLKQHWPQADFKVKHVFISLEIQNPKFQTLSTPFTSRTEHRASGAIQRLEIKRSETFPKQKLRADLSAQQVFEKSFFSLLLLFFYCNNCWSGDFIIIFPEHIKFKLLIPFWLLFCKCKLPECAKCFNL